MRSRLGRRCGARGRQPRADHPGRAVDAQRAQGLARRRVQLDLDGGDRDVGRQLGAGADRLADQALPPPSVPGPASRPTWRSPACQTTVVAARRQHRAAPRGDRELGGRGRAAADQVQDPGQRAHADRRDKRAQARAGGLEVGAELAAGAAGLEVPEGVLGGPARSSWATNRTSRIAAQSASRASAAATSPVRARSTSCREAAGEISSAFATASWLRPSSSRISSAARCCSGRSARSSISRRSSWRRLSRVDVLARTGTVAVGELGGGEPVAAQLVDAEVAHDAVQPRLELDGPARRRAGRGARAGTPPARSPRRRRRGPAAPGRPSACSRRRWRSCSVSNASSRPARKSATRCSSERSLSVAGGTFRG